MKLAHDPLEIPEVMEYIDHIFTETSLSQIQSITNADHDLVWRNWLQSSSYNSISGLDSMPFSAFTPGTSACFGEFIGRYNQRRIRVSKSDFFITKAICRTWNRSMCFLEDDKIRENDVVILSHPFSGNGSDYPTDILHICEELSVPTMIDAAYFGNSSGVDYNLNFNCIQDFTVSLSKCLTHKSLRQGIRFTRHCVDDGINFSIISAGIFNRLGAYMSIKLLEKYSHDWIVKLVEPISQNVCKQNNLSPSNTLTIALGSKEHAEQFTRGDYIRVCITEEIIKNLSQ